MNWHLMMEALGMGWAQSLAGLLGALLLVWVGFSGYKSIVAAAKAVENQKEIEHLHIVGIVVRVLVFLILFSFVVSMMQQTVVYGPKNSLRSPITQQELHHGDIKSNAPDKMTDQERLEFLENERNKNEHLVPLFVPKTIPDKVLPKVEE